jgi:hypothetical protein
LFRGPVSVSGDERLGIGVLYSDGSVAAFSDLFPELVATPSDLPPLRQFVVREGVAIGIDATGQLYMWGRSNVAPFGNPGHLNVPADLGPVQMACYCNGHTLALKADGTVRAWGLNNSGQCNVPPGLSNVIKVSAGKYHSSALTSDGQIVVWGSSPQAPPGTYVDVAAGHHHSLAVRSDGALVHFGTNIQGVATMPSDLGWVQIFDYYNRRGGQRCDGTIVTWGGPYNHVPNLSAHTYTCDCDDTVDCFGDCNGDGVADFFQIMNGELADVNLSGVPDVCEFADCSGNGIPDAVEIANGAPDCNQNGIPDYCEYEGLLVTPLQSPFGAGLPLVHTFANVDLATEPVEVVVEARANLANIPRFVTVRLNGQSFATLWVADGLDCPAKPQRATFSVPASVFNGLAKSGQIVVEVEAAPLVNAALCSDSSAQVTLQYATNFPDCNGNGIDDNCEITDGTLADCNGNWIPDLCELAQGLVRDCNGDGIPDECEIALDPMLDKNGDGILDSCSYARGDFNLDGVVDGADLGVLLSLWGVKSPIVGDLTGDGIVDGADLAVLLGNWGPVKF